ncbi:MAG: DNA polymerase III subunit gamma/tau [Kiritimatiellia bacterium]
MAYEVIARKYRPQTFSDVVGQSHLVTTLANAIRTGRVAHAYLFVGPRGTGKTSTARIFAKALNCEKGMSTEPCNVCDSCREITAGNSLDVMEIDGASNNGVEQVRDLRDSARFMPARGRFEICVIDEVHMLSTGAFNAAQDAGGAARARQVHLRHHRGAQGPATILSRCQRFDLRRISSREIAARLRHIVDAEGLQADDAALDAIARGADGGMRDAQSALDQLLSSCAGGVTEQDVTNIFGLISHRSLADLAGAVARGDARASSTSSPNSTRAARTSTG